MQASREQRLERIAVSARVALEPPPSADPAGGMAHVHADSQEGPDPFIYRAAASH